MMRWPTTQKPSSVHLRPICNKKSTSPKRKYSLKPSRQAATYCSDQLISCLTCTVRSYLHSSEGVQEPVPLHQDHFAPEERPEHGPPVKRVLLLRKRQGLGDLHRLGQLLLYLLTPPALLKRLREGGHRNVAVRLAAVPVLLRMGRFVSVCTWILLEGEQFYSAA